MGSEGSNILTEGKGKLYLDVDYEDPYVQPLLIAALKARLSPDLLVFVNELTHPPPLEARLLGWRQYESVDFECLLAHPKTCLANSYVIRKALIRKHYLASTISHWLTKHPGDARLRDHVKAGVEFEVDYVEFLDDALVEAFELRESWAKLTSLEAEGKGPEWWILKPGMSERGQGIRLFSSEEELVGIFEGWDPASDDEDGGSDGEGDADEKATGIMTSQLRHFVAQPYIHPPLLLPPSHPSAGRKFHIRTYVLAVGALRVYVYRPMLALFAAHDYGAPSAETDELGSHLTNTCLQTGEREGSVHAFWSLPSHLPSLSDPAPADDWRENVFTQICGTTSATFEAAARTSSTHFQPLPNAFEIFGLDFVIDAEGTAWLLEVNAFPDFGQSGNGEGREVVQGLFEGVVEVGVRPFLELGPSGNGDEDMVEVLDLDMGRR
ncbi:hypothetical protein LTR53_009673 [Teratosphaeriaceae sp. CCFEE 6253]|nr:hypothetical protein LTR53_009673 [Teratosphaeriaceae sp. CCFEE 6253]